MAAGGGEGLKGGIRGADGGWWAGGVAAWLRW